MAVDNSAVAASEVLHEDDEGVLPSAAVACAEAMIAVAADAADEDACVS
jgi:hypothetical protein